MWNYINKFTEFNNYQHRVLAKYRNKVYSMPINLMTINNYLEKNFTPNEAKLYIEKNTGGKNQPTNLEEQAIKLIGKELYEAFIKGYTQKQWDTDLTELNASIINRLPVRFNYNDRYFNDKYEGIPVNGYTPIFEKMLDKSNIRVQLKCDYFDMVNEKSNLVIYSGPIDKYFNYKHGFLGWRSIDLSFQKVNCMDFQGTSVMNYTGIDEEFTRIHEYKHLHPEKDLDKECTVIAKEYSRFSNKDEIPYYPINTSDDKIKYEMYRKEMELEADTIFGGRLGTYKYYDMHQVIAQSLTDYKNKVKKLL